MALSFFGALPNTGARLQLGSQGPAVSPAPAGTSPAAPSLVGHLVVEGLAYPPRPNPTNFDCWVSLDLPTSTPANLQVLDSAGRRVYSKEVGSLGPGRHSINIGPELKLKPGLYFIRIAQSGQEVTSRIAIVK